MIEYMNCTRRKFNVRHPRLLRAGLEDDKLIFNKFVKMLIQVNIIIIYIDERSFNSSSLLLYSQMKKGEPLIRVIKNATKDIVLLLLNGITKNIL